MQQSGVWTIADFEPKVALASSPLRASATSPDFMSSQPDDFDLEAAWLRRSQGDLKAFFEALAVRLEGALPLHVTVERRRDGLLSKTSHVARIEVRTDAAIYAISFIKGVVAATRAKVVRGVVISTSAIPVPNWLADVRASVSAMAEQAGGSADVLHDFL